MQVRDVVVNKKIAQGIEIPLPSSKLVLVTTAKGYLMCGYLSLEAAEAKGDCAAIITNVKSVDDMLEAKVTAVTTKAAKAGIKAGMIGQKALLKII